MVIFHDLVHPDVLDLVPPPGDLFAADTIAGGDEHLALVVDAELPAQSLQEGLIAAAPPFVKEVVLFDVYQGKGVEVGKKSLAFRVVMQDTEKTLSDGEVEAAVLKMIEAATGKFAAKLRS